MNTMQYKISRLMNKNHLQYRRKDKLVLSTVTYQALRREIIGTDAMLEMILSGMELPKIDNYGGMQVIILDSDDPNLILVG